MVRSVGRDGANERLARAPRAAQAVQSHRRPGAGEIGCATDEAHAWRQGPDDITAGRVSAL